MRLLLERNTFIALSSSIMISEPLRVLSRQMNLQLRFAMMYVYMYIGIGGIILGTLSFTRYAKVPKLSNKFDNIDINQKKALYLANIQ